MPHIFFIKFSLFPSPYPADFGWCCKVALRWSSLAGSAETATFFWRSLCAWWTWVVSLSGDRACWISVWRSSLVELFWVGVWGAPTTVSAFCWSTERSLSHSDWKCGGIKWVIYSLPGGLWHAVLRWLSLWSGPRRWTRPVGVACPSFRWSLRVEEWVVGSLGHHRFWCRFGPKKFLVHSFYTGISKLDLFLFKTSWKS